MRSNRPNDLSRRSLLKLLGGSALLSACGDNGSSEPKYDPSTAPIQYEGYAGLATLPFFEMIDGRLKCVVDDMPACIDIHSHLGFAVGEEVIDLTQKTDRVHYLVDCDYRPEDCDYRTDVYLNQIANENITGEMDQILLNEPFQPTEIIRSYSVGNLIQEMEDMRFDKSVLLPIAMGLGLSEAKDNMTSRWREAIETTDTGDRFVQFCSVNPKWNTRWETQLRRYVADGYKGLKFHPTMQFNAPDTPLALEVFEVCDELGIPVFFHAGEAGIELPGQGSHASMEHYIAPIEEFPNTQFVFGHSGARDFHEALPIAKAHDNVWMGLAGPALPWLEQMIEEFDNDRILFGSDWPFYPISATLSKVLLATYGDKPLRDQILSHNARRLLNIS